MVRKFELFVAIMVRRFTELYGPEGIRDVLPAAVQAPAAPPAAEPAVEAPAEPPAAAPPAAEPAVEAPAEPPAVEAPAAEPAVEAPAAEPRILSLRERLVTKHGLSATGYLRKLKNA